MSESLSVYCRASSGDSLSLHSDISNVKSRAKRILRSFGLFSAQVFSKVTLNKTCRFEQLLIDYFYQVVGSIDFSRSIFPRLFLIFPIKFTKLKALMRKSCLLFDFLIIKRSCFHKAHLYLWP